MAPREENVKEDGARCFATSLPCLFATGQTGRQNFRAGRDLRDHIVHPRFTNTMSRICLIHLHTLSTWNTTWQVVSVLQVFTE